MTLEVIGDGALLLVGHVTVEVVGVGVIVSGEHVTAEVVGEGGCSIRWICDSMETGDRIAVCVLETGPLRLLET